MGAPLLGAPDSSSGVNPRGSQRTSTDLARVPRTSTTAARALRTVTRDLLRALAVAPETFHARDDPTADIAAIRAEQREMYEKIEKELG